MQVLAQELQLPLERVKLVVASTDTAPWDSGSSGNRVTHVAGQATIRAAAEVRQKLAAVAAEHLGCPESQVELLDGSFRDRERPMAALAGVLSRGRAVSS